MISNLLLSLVAMLEGAGRDEGYKQLHLLYCSSISDTCCPRDLHFLQAYLHAGTHSYLFKEGSQWHSLPRGAKPQISYFSQLRWCSFTEKVLGMNHNCTYIRLNSLLLTAILIATLISRIYSAFHSHKTRQLEGQSSLLGCRIKLQWISNPSPW